MSTKSNVSVRWSIFKAEEDPKRGLFRRYWDMFGCVLLGHRIYVLPDVSPQPVLVLDTNACAWQVLPTNGLQPSKMIGGTLVAFDDKLTVLKGRVPRLESVQLFDSVLLEWSEVEVSGDQLFPVEFFVTDYWEAKRVVLINTRNDTVMHEKAPNLTFTLNVDSMQLREVKTTGPPPSRRYYHSSILLEDMKQWVIICGQGPRQLLSDIYFLDLERPKPTWTKHRPFSKLKGVSVCSPLRIGSNVLIFGGVRSGLSNTEICSYNLTTGDVEEGIFKAGDDPPTTQCSFQRVVKQNDERFYFIASQKLTGLHRVFRGQVRGAI